VTQGSIMGDSLLYGYGSNVTGDVFLTPTGGLVDGKPSSFQLDLRTMKSSDEGMTEFFKGQMEVAKFPMSEFVSGAANGIPPTFQDGNEFTFTMTGPLTMHGRTKNITWRVKARQQGEFFAYAADGDFLMTDYGWTPPNYGVAWAKNSVHIQVSVIARRDNSDFGEPQARIVTPAQPSLVTPGASTAVAPDASSQAPGAGASPAVVQAPAGLLPQGEAPAAAAGGQPSTAAGGGLGGLGDLSSLTNLFTGQGMPSLDDIMKLFNPDDLMKLLMPSAGR
jgi:hypothetical protein